MDALCCLMDDMFVFCDYLVNFNRNKILILSFKISAPLWIYMLTRQLKGEIRVSWILVSKTVSCLFHIIFSFNF